MDVAMPILPLAKREEAGKVRAQTPDTRSPSCVSSGDGRDTDDASTPRNLWPATPTPTPRYGEPVSFMMLPVEMTQELPQEMTPFTAAAEVEPARRRTKMNANAQAFIPSSLTPVENRFMQPEAEIAMSESSIEVSSGDSVAQEVPNVGSTMHGAGRGTD
ncbi:unnamed protein product, partial [Effrenium voratum]